MNRATIRRLAAFTFVEILAALVFLGILMPAVISALSLSSRASLIAERTAVATQLAENQMNQLLLDGTWNTGGTRGDFADWKDYHWELRKDSWPSDAMNQLTLIVTFSVQGHEQNVQLTTLAADAEAKP